MKLRSSKLFVDSVVRLFVNTSLAIVFGSVANAQWTVVNLHPAGATESAALFVKDGKQVGQAKIGGQNHASLWNGSALTWVDLNPTGATESYTRCIDGSQQVGYAKFAGQNLAGLWSGTAATWLNINPAGATESYGYGADNGQQSGMAVIGGAYRASVWSGTPASWVNMAIGSSSQAYGAAGGQQVGYELLGTRFAAMLWSGTAASWVNLHHESSGFHSYALGVHGGHQVGYSTDPGGTVFRANLWSGTALSWVSLHPTVATASVARGVHGSHQVGNVGVDGVGRASLWSGTATSWVDLHAVLPADFSSSLATSVWHDSAFTYVVGNGFNTTTNRYEALMWVRPITLVQPTSYNILQGTNFGGNLASLFNSDNDKVYVLCDEFDSNGEIQFDSTLPAGTVNQLKFKFEGSASRNDLSQFVRMFNYSTNAYTNVSFQTATIIDSVVEGTITTGVANYYSGTREVKSRVFWVPQADIDASDGWSQSCDQVLWTMN